VTTLDDVGLNALLDGRLDPSRRASDPGPARIEPQAADAACAAATRAIGTRNGEQLT
jgi:hypothetical protein